MLRRRRRAATARGQRGEPCAPVVRAEHAAPADVEDGRHQAIAFAVDVEVTLGHDLARDRGEDRVELGALERGVERELQQQIGAMRDPVAPTVARVEAAVVAHTCQIDGCDAHQFGAFSVGQERSNAIGARDLGERERCQRLFEARRIRRRGRETGEQHGTHRLQRRRRELAVA